MLKFILFRLRLIWADARGDDLTALILRKEFLMADFTALNDAVSRVVDKVKSDQALLDAANATIAAGDAAIQPQIDALVAQIDAVAPLPPQEA